MPNKDEIDLLVGVTYPNGVTFKSCETYSYCAVFICEHCERLGLRWSYVSDPSGELLVNSSRDYTYHIHSVLHRHAMEHNELCQKLEEMVRTHSPIVRVEYLAPNFEVPADGWNVVKVTEEAPEKPRKRLLRPVGD